MKKSELKQLIRETIEEASSGRIQQSVVGKTIKGAKIKRGGTGWADRLYIDLGNGNVLKIAGENLDFLVTPMDRLDPFEYEEAPDA